MGIVLLNMENTIDELDKKIADLLAEDGRMSSTQIARSIGHITERTVRYRIERLRKMGIIEICAVPVPSQLGYVVNADVFVEVEPGKSVAVAEEIAQYENVPYVACSTGTNDLSIQVVAHNNAELFRFVNDVLGKIEGVRKTVTSVVPLVIKDVYRWRIPSSIVTKAEKNQEKRGLKSSHDTTS